MTPGFVSDAVLADDRRGSRAMASGRLEGLRMLRATGPGRIVRSLGRPDGAVPTAHWSKAFLPITLSSQSTPAGEQIAVCMENTTWLGFTDTFPEGLALVVEADPTRPTLSLLSVSARDGNWSSESAAEPGWGYLEVDSVARASLASRPGGNDVLIGWITQGGGDGAAAGVVAVAYTADGNLFRPPVQASDPAHLSIQNVCLVFVETPGGTADFGALLAYSARSADTGSVRRVYLRWSEDGGFNWDTRSFVLDDSASATTEQDFPCVVASTSADANGSGPVVMFAWRAELSERIGVYTRAAIVSELVDAFNATSTAAITWPQDVEVLAAATAADGKEPATNYRDPGAWCTPSGRFWVGYTRQPTPGDPVAMVAESPGPAHGAGWASGELESGSDFDQDFVHGDADETSGYAVAAWNVWDTVLGVVEVYGASLDLATIGATWTALGAISVSEETGDQAAYPAIRMSPSGQYLVGYIWINAAQTETASRVRWGLP